MPQDSFVLIMQHPGTFLLLVIGLCLLVQLIYIIRGDAEWTPPLPPEVDSVSEAKMDSGREPESIAPAAVSDPLPAGLPDKDATELGIQAWRLQKRVSMLPLQDHPKHKRRLDDSVSQINRLLQKFEIEVEDPIGQHYDEGWSAVEIASTEIVEPWPRDADPRPYVHETVRPIIRRGGQIIKTGQVIIGEKE